MSATPKIAATDIADVSVPIVTIFYNSHGHDDDVISVPKYCDMVTFGCFTYAQKGNEITFTMQLVSCQNSCGINKNYQKSMLTVLTGMMMSSWSWLL
jgi:hypothetical protein